jgi:N-acetylglucosamine-6-sulfatase
VPVTSTGPNIVVLMVDDLAEIADHRIWDRLPAIRSLFIDHGLQFTNYFGNTPLCCPGRVNFLTGLRTEHHGVWMNDARLFHPEESIATELHDLGYYTFISGKYLNFTSKLVNKWPPGWDHASVFGGTYYDYPMWKDGVRIDRGHAPADYSTTVFAKDAAEFLAEAPADRPVFAFLTPFAVHSGADEHGHTVSYMPAPARNLIGDPRCAGIPPFRTPATNEADVSDKPGYIAHLPVLPVAKNGWPLDRDCEALLSVDAEVATIRDMLASQGRLDDTLFILTADNGMAFARHRWAEKRVPYATQLDLYVHWPNGIGRKPGTVNAMEENIDLAPTLCELAGCVMGPYPTGQQVADGRSFLDVIRNRGGSGRQYLVEEDVSPRPPRPPFYALRSSATAPIGPWHYVEYRDGERELYDLARDPNELHNLAADPRRAALMARLSAKLAAERGTAGSGARPPRAVTAPRIGVV